MSSGDTPEPGPDEFESLIEPLLFDGGSPGSNPELRLLPSQSTSGRSRAAGTVTGDAVWVCAADLEVIAGSVAGSGGADPRQVAAGWVQRGLALARKRRLSVVLEGRFRSPELIAGIVRLFADAGYRTSLTAVAERWAEVRMSDASVRFDALRRGHAGARQDAVDRVDLAAIVGSAGVDRVTVLDRTGAVVSEGERGSDEYVRAPSALEDAAAARLGTMRSTLWLSQLRRMTRFAGELRMAPRWAVDELIDLHEVALSEIVPELPIPAGSETMRVQVERLTATLTALQLAVQDDAADLAAPAVVLQPDGPTVIR